MGSQFVTARILLDTHILVWWRTDRARLEPAQAQVMSELEERGEPVAISAITLWELAKMVHRGRLSIERPLGAWLQEIEDNPLIRIVPITAAISVLSAQLEEGFHKDPADHIIVATARYFGVPLITADSRIRSWGRVRTI
jgi:PIN domain nuclease of toxin-antitoxin system